MPPPGRCEGSEFGYHHIVKFGLIIQGVCPHADRCTVHGRCFAVFLGHELAELHDLRLVGSEINVFRAPEQTQHTEIVGQLPIVLIHSALGRKIRRIQHEQRPAVAALTLEQFPVVHVNYFQPVQIAVALIRARSYAVIHSMLAKLVQTCNPFAGEKHRPPDCQNVHPAEAVLRVVDNSQNIGTLPVCQPLVRLQPG